MPAEQERDDDQVPGRGHRQELGESLDDPHDQRLDDGVHRRHLAPMPVPAAIRGALTGAAAIGRGVAVAAVPYRMKSGARTSVIVASSLTRTWSDGPAVSLNGSPTVSPTTAAAWACGLLAEDVAVRRP